MPSHVKFYVILLFVSNYHNKLISKLEDCDVKNGEHIICSGVVW